MHSETWRLRRQTETHLGVGPLHALHDLVELGTPEVRGGLEPREDATTPSQLLEVLLEHVLQPESRDTP